MRFLQPSSFLLKADSLRHDVVLALEQGDVSIVQCADLPPAAKVEHFPNELWTAPPILLHAHLESFDAPSETWPRESFSSWVEALLTWRQTSKRMSAAESADSSWTELRNAGCGGVLSSVSEPGATPPFTTSDVVGNCLTIPELFAPDPKQAESVVQTLGEEFSGVALHAPFSVSEALAKQSFLWLKSKPGRLLSIHLGEHAEEREFLCAQSGPLAELLQARGRECKPGRWSSPVDWLEDVAPGKIPGTLTVHCGDLKVAELQQLSAKQAQVVWCPGTHQYFDRPRPAFYQAGLKAPLLGCDSKASNAVLDPLREVRIARQVLPEYGPVEWWRALTERAALVWPVSQPIEQGGGQSRPGWPTTFGSLPLRFVDPDLPTANAVCDYLTSESNLTPLGPAGIPAPKE